MRKVNCWEHQLCGRQLGGQKEMELGVCPVSINTKINKVNGGVNGGRYCWNAKDSLCEYQQHGTFAQKQDICLNCEFRNLVKKEEGDNFIE